MAHSQSVENWCCPDREEDGRTAVTQCILHLASFIFGQPRWHFGAPQNTPKSIDRHILTLSAAGSRGRYLSPSRCISQCAIRQYNPAISQNNPGIPTLCTIQRHTAGTNGQRSIKLMNQPHIISHHYYSLRPCQLLLDRYYILLTLHLDHAIHLGRIAHQFHGSSVHHASVRVAILGQIVEEDVRD